MGVNISDLIEEFILSAIAQEKMLRIILTVHLVKSIMFYQQGLLLIEGLKLLVSEVAGDI